MRKGREGASAAASTAFDPTNRDAPTCNTSSNGIAATVTTTDAYGADLGRCQYCSSSGRRGGEVCAMPSRRHTHAANAATAAFINGETSYRKAARCRLLLHWEWLLMTADWCERETLKRCCQRHRRPWSGGMVVVGSPAESSYEGTYMCE